MATTKAQMLEAIKEAGDDPSEVVCCWSHPGVDELITSGVDELPERKYSAGYDGVEGEPCIAFSPRYVYVKEVYDGAECFVAVPRHPEFVTYPRAIGGG